MLPRGVREREWGMVSEEIVRAGQWVEPCNNNQPHVQQRL